MCILSECKTATWEISGSNPTYEFSVTFPVRCLNKTTPGVHTSNNSTPTLRVVPAHAADSSTSSRGTNYFRAAIAAVAPRQAHVFSQRTTACIFCRESKNMPGTHKRLVRGSSLSHPGRWKSSERCEQELHPLKVGVESLGVCTCGVVLLRDLVGKVSENSDVELQPGIPPREEHGVVLS